MMRSILPWMLAKQPESTALYGGTKNTSSGRIGSSLSGMARTPPPWSNGMLGEFDWDHINELIDAYASASVHGDDVPELERKLVEPCSGVVDSSPNMDDFTALLDT